MCILISEWFYFYRNIYILGPPRPETLLGPRQARTKVQASTTDLFFQSHHVTMTTSFSRHLVLPHMVGRRVARPCSVWVYRCLTCTPAYGRLLWAAYVCVERERACVLRTCMYCTVGECVCWRVHECVCVLVSVCLNVYVCEAALGGGVIDVSFIISLLTALALTDERISLNCLYLIFINTSISDTAGSSASGPRGNRY